MTVSPTARKDPGQYPTKDNWVVGSEKTSKPNTLRHPQDLLQAFRSFF